MTYLVKLTRQAEKQKEKLPEKVQGASFSIARDFPKWPGQRRLAQLRKTWPKLHHCHIKKGKPTYVAVWQEIGGEIRLVEITYVGTHEKAPY